jgi:hypothetical protein
MHCTRAAPTSKSRALAPAKQLMPNQRTVRHSSATAATSPGFGQCIHEN